MEVRVLVELADQRPPRLTGSEPREGVRSIAPVPGEHEFPPGKPAQQHAQKLPHQVARRLVTASSLLVLFGSPVQRAQHRQRPGAVQARLSHLDRQHDPTSLRPVPVSPLPRCVRVRGTDGVAMPALAVDLLPRMLRDGVVAADRDRAARNETIDDASRENPRQPPRRPAPLREHAVIARPMAFGQRPGDPQQTTDRVATDAHDRGEHEHAETRPHRLGELAGPFVKDGSHSLRYAGHRSFLARRDSRLVHTSNPPAGRLFVFPQPA